MVFFKKFFSTNSPWKILLTQTLLVLTTSYFNRAIALSVEDYCLSKIEPKKLKIEPKKYPLKRDNEIWFPQTQKAYLQYNQNKYSIKIYRGVIQLFDDKSNTLISETELPYEKDSNVSSGYITKNNWLYINKDKNNYAVKINPGSSDSYLKYDVLPKIYPEQCNRFTNWFNGGCYVEHFKTFSSSNKVFLTGHELKPGSRKWVVMEISEGKPKIFETTEQIESILHIPELNGFILKGVKGKIFFYDEVKVEEIKTPEPVDRVLRYISRLNGVLLQGTKGVVLFYNGTHVKEILSPFPRQPRGARDWYLAEVATFEGNEWNNDDERIFLYNPGRKTPRLFMELKSDLSLEPVSFPKGINKMKVDLVRFPNDSLLWAISRDGNILAEVNGKFKSVVIVSKSNRISWNTPLTAPLLFEVENMQANATGKKNEKYFLRKASSSANCKIMLDPNRPVELNVN
ncbi:MAG: hypothetical protein AAFY50_00860 [Cyanobacteria bacterium J06648_1]